MYGRYRVDIRLVNRRKIGIVKQKNIIGENFVLSKSLNNSLYGEPCTRHMLTECLACRQDVSIGPVNRRHIVMLLSRINSSPCSLQGNPHLLCNLVEPVGQDLECDWIDSSVLRIHGTCPTFR